MKISLEKLIHHLVVRGTQAARTTPLRSDERSPTSIRLAPRTRHFLEAQAEVLNTSVQAVISTILDGVAEATTDTAGAELRTIRERFLLLAEAHDLGLPDLVDVMTDFGFTLSAFGSTERLLDLLTSAALAHAASVFHVRPDWLTGRSSFAPGREFGWYKNLEEAAERITAYREAGLFPTAIFVRQQGADFVRAKLDNDSGACPDEPVGVVLRLRRSTTAGKSFATYDVWRLERWNYWRCREQIKLLVAFCEQAKVSVVGHELPSAELQALATGHQLPVALLSRLGAASWNPDDYASITDKVIREPDEWLEGARDEYLKSPLPEIATRAAGIDRSRKQTRA